MLMPVRAQRRFRFRWLPFVITVLLVALGVSLGNWQQRRAAQKVAQEAKLVAGNLAAPLALGPQPLSADTVREQLLYRRVTLRGEFVPRWTLYLDNRPYNGRAGFYVLTPFRLAGSTMHVLVERGWLPRDPLQRDHLPAYTTPAGSVAIEGLVKASTGHVMQLGTAAALAGQAIVQNLEPAELAAASGLRFQPLVLQQGGAGHVDDGLVRDWPAPALGVERNRGYAFQWYALSVMALVFFVVTGWRRKHG